MLPILQKLQNQGNISDQEFQQIFNKCQGRFFRYRITERQIQQDIMQEVMLKCCQHLDKINKIAEYFWAIFGNELNNYHHRDFKKAQQLAPLDTLRGCEVRPNVEAQLTCEACWQVLNTCPSMAQAFRLSLEDRKYSEIGEILGLDYRTVQKLCRQAHALLATLCK